MPYAKGPSRKEYRNGPPTQDFPYWRTVRHPTKGTYTLAYRTRASVDEAVQAVHNLRAKGVDIELLGYGELAGLSL